VLSLLVLLCAAAPPAAVEATPVVIDVDPGVMAAARALGPRAAFFTARAHPLARLGDLGSAVDDVGTGDVAGAKELMALLRAGGVKLGGGAVDVARLFGRHHFSTLFRARPRLRLFVVRARPDGAERAIVDRGGGVRLQLRARGQLVGLIQSDGAPGPAKSAAGAGFATSFGPLVRAELGDSARARHFDPREGVRVEKRQARPGQQLVILHVTRDFTVGAGVVSFLFGSGIIVKPEFEQLAVVDGGGRALPLVATYAEGRTVELAYEVPRGATAGLKLRDGDAEVALGALVGPGSGRPAAAAE
jgi:hypothetical protein